MTDLARLTEAMKFLAGGPWVDRMSIATTNAVAELANAARLVVDGKPGWYCETHEQWDWNDAQCWAADMGPDLCRMVDAVLVIR